MTTFFKTHVPSGSFLVKETLPMILEAHLGTCVGVAITDKRRKLGGMMHLLLPEPVSLTNTIYYPEKYATTGLPLFLNQFYELGANPSDMTATIAGGALLGPVRMQDISLDIGGRIAEHVKTILMQEGIYIEFSETGGLFPCCMRLNLKTLESEVNPSGHMEVSHTEPFIPPAPAELETLAEKIKPVPQIVLKILRIINGGRHDLWDIASEVRKDQVLSAKTLRLSNSALFRGKHAIVSIEEALRFLGKDNFMKLIITASVNDYFNQVESGYSLCKGGLFHHALGSAIIASKLTRFVPSVPKDVAYTAGLLHDIGIVVLDQYMTKAYPLFYRDLWKSQDLLSTEKKYFGLDHCTVGQNLATKWGLPAILVDTIFNHHMPEHQIQNAALAHLVYMADLLMYCFRSGLRVDHMDMANLESRLKYFGMSISDIAKVVADIPMTLFNQNIEMHVNSKESHS